MKRQMVCGGMFHVKHSFERCAPPREPVKIRFPGRFFASEYEAARASNVPPRLSDRAPLGFSRAPGPGARIAEAADREGLAVCEPRQLLEERPGDLLV
ncbi:MAG: hypothetical protein ACLSVD_17770, partial [Eggerthellaceae bacterium]